MVKTVGSWTTETETLSWSAMRRGSTILQMTLTWKKKFPLYGADLFFCHRRLSAALGKTLQLIHLGERTSVQ